jgi:hypothetical protein
MWKRGFRAHGYWSGTTRLGVASLGPRGLWGVLYRWAIDASGEAGTADTLAAAKACVEEGLRAIAERDS